ncbi:hypothetical protein [Rubrolithibacter danxiaensis]|uniref:hypothetical protein n=1 Tax=Rubrolithibacter danxiaensis TaxID=3390805 RepID=UPI003BF8EDF4
MTDIKGNQWVKPNNKPSEQNSEPRNEENENIIKGAQQEDQLEGLKPDAETDRKIASEPADEKRKEDEDSSGPQD